MVCLSNFSGKEAVLRFLDIKCNSGYDVMCSGLFGGGIAGEWCNWRDDLWGSPGLQLEARKTSG